ncbi:hypothetical protein [Pseudomonas sp. Bc-h]|jgi:hypothetical protein|uniref:hypothetical protein n=1 Tax=Pseudomonas sp. Bc-h TaxID=1943632 RepID=UPI00117BB018|nr:hypothetical protein [Pseudomonas sp. Bc-h]
MAMSVSTMTSTVSDDDVMGRQANYEPYLRRFEAEAMALERGFKTALFIEQFKAGLLPNAGRDSHRLQ